MGVSQERQMLSANLVQDWILWPTTIANKITGLLLFLLPLTLPFIDLQYSAPIVCFMATIAAIQEGYCIRTECEPV